MEPIVEGKVKTVYQGVDPNEVLIHYHDKVTAGNGEKKTEYFDKGKINAQISSILFKKLNEKMINTHFISLDGPGLMRCKKVDIIPIEVVVRNVATGSIVRETTIEEGVSFKTPLVEFYLKDDSKGDPLLTTDRIAAMGFVSPTKKVGYKMVTKHCSNPVTLMDSYAREVNSVLKQIFSEIDIDLIDFKIEFGYDSNGKMLVADEISPDGCRLWKKETAESMDKDLFRKDTGNIIDAYKEILERLIANDASSHTTI